MTRTVEEIARTSGFTVEPEAMIALLTPEEAAEAGLARAICRNRSRDGFVVVSADRGDRVPARDPRHPTPDDYARNAAENAVVRARLARLIRAERIRMTSAWTETLPDGTTATATAETFVGVGVGVSREEAARLAAAAFAEPFRQPAVLWGLEDVGLFILKRDGSVEPLGVEFDAGTVMRTYKDLRSGIDRSPWAVAASPIEITGLHPPGRRSTHMADHLAWRRELWVRVSRRTNVVHAWTCPNVGFDPVAAGRSLAAAVAEKCARFAGVIIDLDEFRDVVVTREFGSAFLAEWERRGHPVAALRERVSFHGQQPALVARVEAVIFASERA